MSWQRGQGFGMGAAPLFGMHDMAMQGAAAMGAAKPMVEAMLAQVPDGIDWLAFQAGVGKFMAAQAAVGAPRVEYPVLATAGRASLRDAGGTGPMVVLVPSMINKGYVLDLHPGHSVVEGLKQAGFRVVLVDWGTPVAGQTLTLEQVVAGHLLPLLRQAAALNGGPVHVLGYCMGGTLALAAAVVLGKETIAKLALAATPWDFSQTASATHMATSKAMLEPWLAGMQVIPADTINQYFWALDPWSGVKRLMALGRATDPARVAHMLALETWLHDGQPLDGPVAREMLFEWYAANAPLKGAWKVDGKAITPGTLAMPLWVAIPQNDNLVPPLCSLPLVGQAPGAQVVSLPVGHVGLVCGRRALELLVNPLAGWLKS